jgi:integrase
VPPIHSGAKGNWVIDALQWRSVVKSQAASGGKLIIGVFTIIIGTKRFKKSARYALQNIRSIIEWAREEEPPRFSGTNPVNLTVRPVKSKFLRRLPSLEYETATRRAMPPEDVPAFIARLRAQRGYMQGGGKSGCYGANERPLPCECIEFQILTGARPVQARLARWRELDLDSQTWTVPQRTIIDGKVYNRRKRKGVGVFYLNRPAVKLLREIKKRQETKEGGLRDFVFSHGPSLIASPGYHPAYALERKETSKYGNSDFRFGGKVLGPEAVHSYFTETLGIKDYDLHGFRGSFKKFQARHGLNELAGEAVLDHKVGDYVRNVYAGTVVPYDPLRELMDFWGQHCDGKFKLPVLSKDDPLPARVPQKEEP